MKINEDVWKFYQKHFGYNDDEMKKFQAKPQKRRCAFPRRRH